MFAYDGPTKLAPEFGFELQIRRQTQRGNFRINFVRMCRDDGSPCFRGAREGNVKGYALIPPYFILLWLHVRHTCHMHEMGSPAHYPTSGPLDDDIASLLSSSLIYLDGF